MRIVCAGVEKHTRKHKCFQKKKSELLDQRSELQGLLLPANDVKTKIRGQFSENKCNIFIPI